MDVLFDEEQPPPFALILGAGASRSAGIPVTSEMVNLLRLHLKLMSPGFPLAELPNTFSGLIRELYDIAQDEWHVREFFRRCIRRGSREPNVVHLVAANLACAGVFKPIVTTNFDDLALAAFWQLPSTVGYSEPYVVYDPKMVRLTQIHLGEETPVIIKAHGHHTQYGRSVIEEEIRGLAPFVKKTLRAFGTPRIGYIVAGCSGSWADGIIDLLKDDRITRGKII